MKDLRRSSNCCSQVGSMLRCLLNANAGVSAACLKGRAGFKNKYNKYVIKRRETDSLITNALW